MSSRRRAGFAPFGTAQKYMVYAPVECWSGAEVKPPLLFCHGALGHGWQANDHYLASRLLHALSLDYVVLDCDWGGNLFGNDVAMGLMNDGLSYIRTNWNASNDDPVVVGWSMGGCQVLNYALDNDVAAVAAMIPATDLEYVYDNNILGMAATIDAAYGGTYDQATDGPLNDPKEFAASLDPSVPIALFVSTDDPYLPNETAHRFCWERPSTIYKEWGAYGHGIASVGLGRDEVLAFLADPESYEGDEVPAEPSGEPPTFASISALDTGTTTADRTPAVPSGVAAGSLVIVAVASNATSNGGAVTDFTEIAATTYAQASARALWKRATGADAGTYSVSHSGGFASSALAFRVEGELASGNPIGGTNSATAVAVSTIPTTSLTGTTPNSLLVHVAFSANARTYTPPTGFTRRTVDASQRLHVSTMPNPSGGNTGAVNGSMSAFGMCGALLFEILPA